MPEDPRGMGENRKTGCGKTPPKSNSSLPASRFSGGKNSRRTAKIITLLTDFGLTDPYVGVMKGVVAGVNSETRIIDLCHDVAPQDVRGAAFLLAGSFEYFPPGTIHVAVVDPTVGGERRAICVQSGRYFFIGPDNGVISVASYRAGRPKIFLLENEKYFLEKRSRTFHGRDIFAPVAAHLSAGAPVESMGRRVRSMKRIRLKAPVVTRGRGLRGQIMHVDRFGNLITNIDEDCIRKTFPRIGYSGLVVTCEAQRICGLSECYSDAPTGLAVALFGSYNLMEIAVRDGNASSILGLEQGDEVGVESAGKHAR